MNSREYYLQLLHVIHTTPYVISSNIHFEEIDIYECYIHGIVTLIGNYELHIAEYVETAPPIARPKYRYHLQTFTDELLSRWDNAPHHPTVTTFPHHRHGKAEDVYPSRPMDLPAVLQAVIPLIEL